MPAVSNASVVAMVASTTVSFSVHLGQDCGSPSYAVVFVSGTGMTATANYSGATITFDFIGLAKVGSWSYKVVLTADGQTFDSNTATLTVINPCLGTAINDQTISFSSLAAAYQ